MATFEVLRNVDRVMSYLNCKKIINFNNELPKNVDATAAVLVHFPDLEFKLRRKGYTFDSIIEFFITQVKGERFILQMRGPGPNRRVGVEIITCLKSNLSRTEVKDFLQFYLKNDFVVSAGPYHPKIKSKNVLDLIGV